MPTFTQEVVVDFDLNDILDDDLIDELEDRGYRVYETNTKSQQDLLNRLEEDGYEIRKAGSARSELESVLYKLYDLYKDKEVSHLFEKEFKKTIRHYTNINVY